MERATSARSSSSDVSVISNSSLSAEKSTRLQQAGATRPAHQRIGAHKIGLDDAVLVGQAIGETAVDPKDRARRERDDGPAAALDARNIAED
ncbi:hypothetical protein [Rhizobium gallicum]|uniref:hypothetical protein n=1 Tax=Rhizobium gallicum TaxID=56730 RepID=UPI001EF88684|nr:hypothetical protein [Rhizobium gallicum]ULJ75955.1 hypothetical protein L2W42_26030 [Rhizobium gallicum]